MIFEYIEIFYNRKDYIHIIIFSPSEFEEKNVTEKKKVAGL